MNLFIAFIETSRGVSFIQMFFFFGRGVGGAIVINLMKDCCNLPND